VGGNGVDIKLFYKEQKIDLQDVSTAITIAGLKERITIATEVPAARQRLIFNGRQLKPDDRTLQAFGIGENAYIHLFPMPENFIPGT